jgi:hypothetical protein
VWYKDEGGRDKCIELKVHLLDAASNHVHDRRVRAYLRRTAITCAAKALGGTNFDFVLSLL